jgi:hypothetical protein
MQNTAPNHPSPKRIKSGWDDARRKRHAAAMRQWAPWTSSTGPRTRAGKAISSQNAYKHGLRGREVKAINRFVRDCGRYTKVIKKGLKLAKHLKRQGILMGADSVCKAMLQFKKIENPTNELLKDSNVPPYLQLIAFAHTPINNKHNAKILHFPPP